MAVIWDQVPGQSELKTALRGAFARGHLAHALLLSGADKDLNRKMALGLGQLLVCETGGPCGACGPCRRVELESSESLKWLAPEAGVIKIDQVRELRESLSLKSWAGRRFVVIEQAHGLNPQAANALLKSLEEPPPDTFFLLLTTHERSLLPTIRSRTQVVRVVAPLNEAADWGEPEKLEMSAALWSELARGRNPRGHDAVKELFSSKEAALETIRVWAQILHLARRGGITGASNPGLDPALVRSLGARPASVDRGWQALMAMKGEIEGQVDRTLAVDSFLISVSEGFQP